MRHALHAFVLLLAVSAVGCNCGSDTPPINDQDAGSEEDDGGTLDDGGTDGGLLCGNGAQDTGEGCDDGAQNSDLAANACRTNCQPAGCGDGVIDSNERCDDGNTTPGDGCSATCAPEPSNTCGDGTLDISKGEQCDDGNTTASDGCSPTCRFEALGATCGNNSTQAPLEVCDDGNTTNADNCNPTCNLTNTTSLFIGVPGQPGIIDGDAGIARVGAEGALTADKNYLWLADTQNHVVRRIDIAAQRIVTLAGVGRDAGYADSPSGLGAQFRSPLSITTDGRTVWIGDNGNHRIRAMSVQPPHAVTTIAGSGVAPTLADGGVGPYTDGIGTAASVGDLRGLTYLGGFLYFVEANHATVRRVNPKTGEVTTVAGTQQQFGNTDGVGPAARFRSPRYMTSDSDKVLYIIDTNGNQIRTFDTTTAAVATLAGSGATGYTDGVGTAAVLSRPRGIASDGTSVYFTEQLKQTIRQAVISSASVTTQIGNPCGQATCAGNYMEGVGSAARLDTPWAITYHFSSLSGVPSALYFIDAGNNVIRRIR